MDLQNLLSNNKNNLPLSSASGLLGGSTNSFLSGNKQIPDSAGLGFLKSTQPILSPSPQLSGNKTLSALIAPQKNNMIKNTSTLKKVDPTISVAPVSNAKGIEQGQSFFGSVFNKMGQDVFKPEYQTPNIVSSQNGFNAPQDNTMDQWFDDGDNGNQGGSDLDSWGTNTNTNNTSTTNNMFGGSDTTMNTGSEFNTGNNQDLNKFDVDKYFQVIDTMNPTLEEMYQIRNAINNKRNDVAVGEVDPYELFTKRGITATPKMIENMRKSTAGIYDPLLSDINGKILAQERREELALKNKGTDYSGFSGGSANEFGIDSNEIANSLLSNLSGSKADNFKNGYNNAADKDQFITSFIYQSLLNGAQRSTIDSLKELKGGYNLALDYADSLGKDIPGGVYNKKIQDLKKYLGKDKNKEFLEFNSLISSSQAAPRVKVTGVAMSDKELDLINQYMVSPSDTVGDAIAKMNVQEKYLEWKIKIAPLQAMGYNIPMPSANQLLNGTAQTGVGTSGGGLSQQEIQALKQRGFTDEEINNYSGGFKSVGGGTNKAINNVNDAMQRIAKVESQGSGGYNAIGPVVKKGDYKGQKAVGKYQVMQGNIGPWTKEALGQTLTPTQFLNSPQAQDAVARYFLQKAYDKYGTWNDAASVWFTGQPASKAIARGANDGLSSVQQYLNKFNT